MVISSTLVTAILKGDDISEKKDEWYFRSSIPFVAPSSDNETKESVRKCYKAIKEHLLSFVPVNRLLFDKLFPAWQSVELPIDLIVGYPSPYDAVTEIGPDGNTHIILDLIQIANYGLSAEQLPKVIRNLVTHEMTHVLIGEIFPEIARAPGGTDYLEAMNANIFNEGFAHLLSFNGLELHEIDWSSKELMTVFDESKSALRAAILVQDAERQTELLEQSNTGSYYCKFASMSGMLYLAEQWKKSGTQGLKKEIDLGYRSIISRIISDT